MVSVFQRFPLVSYCCFCYSLRKGNIIIALYYILFFLLTCAQLLWNPCYTNILTRNCPCRQIFWVLVFIFCVVNMIALVTAAVLLLCMSYAISKGVSYFLYLHFVAAVLMPLFLNFTVTAFATYYHFTDKSSSCFVGRNIGLCLFLTVVYISFALYCISMVSSYRDGYDLNFPDEYETPKPKWAQYMAKMGGLTNRQKHERMIDEFVKPDEGIDEHFDSVIAKRGPKNPCEPCGKKQTKCMADDAKTRGAASPKVQKTA